jgi:hypothetical protein
MFAGQTVTFLPRVSKGVGGGGICFDGHHLVWDKVILE